MQYSIFFPPFRIINKLEFIEKRNDVLVSEPLVECLECGRRQHQICNLYMDKIWPEGFTCDGCLKRKNQVRKENKFTAKKLPTNKLSNHLETRVNKFLKTNKASDCKVYIRVLSSVDKAVEVQEGMKKR